MTGRSVRGRIVVHAVVTTIQMAIRAGEATELVHRKVQERWVHGTPIMANTSHHRQVPHLGLLLQVVPQVVWPLTDPLAPFILIMTFATSAPNPVTGRDNAPIHGLQAVSSRWM